MRCPDDERKERAQVAPAATVLGNTVMNQSRRGPKRSEASRRAILEATRDILHADGFDKLTLDGIARRAGVGKQTLYRWWPSKAAIVVDAVLDGFIATPPLAEPAGADLAGALHDWLLAFRAQIDSPLGTALARALTAAAAVDDTAAARLYTHFTGPLREHVRDRLVASDELRRNADHLAAADALIGTLIFLMLSRQPIEHGHLAGLLDVVLNGLRTRQGTSETAGTGCD